MPPPEILERAASLMDVGRPQQIITGNALLIMEAQENQDLSAACTRAEMITGESSGIQWAVKLRHKAKLERIAGIDLALNLCERAALTGKPVYLFGGAQGVAEKAARRLKAKFPSIHIVGARNGFFNSADESIIVEDIRRSGAKLVLVALGMPKQDIWVHLHRLQLPPALYIGVGGSLDVWAGNVKRAPKSIQNMGLEWLYRLFQEPWRWRRMLQLPKFAYMVLTQKRR